MAEEPVRPDAPNQQVVRPDGSHPSDEGTGAGKAKRSARTADKPRDTGKADKDDQGAG